MKQVFKYRFGTDRDIETLEQDSFWAPTRENLNDPYEGVFSRTISSEQLEQLERILRVPQGSFDELGIALDSVLDFADKSGVYSLSKTAEDELLWAHYANSHKGFCIEYDLDKLIEFTQSENYIVPVDYSESPPHIILSDVSNLHDSQATLLQKMLGTKSKRWEYEQEVRIVSSQAGSHPFDYRAVKALYFGLRMSEERQDEIMKRLSGRGINYYKMKMSDNYSFIPITVEDPYLGASPYQYEVSPILDLAITPEHVNEKYIAYVDYLYKAAEIIRRDPYCSAVEFVEFSPEKSTPENPVVLIMCPKCQNRWPRYYLSLQEIDAQYPMIKDLVVS